MAKGKKRKLQEINASSMADIAFLLLIFFLVTTTMDVDKGLLVLLPPYSEEPPPETKENQRNVLDILVNSRDQLLVKGELMEVRDLKDMAIKHVNNRKVNPKYSDSPQEAVVSLKSDRGTSYDIYITVQNELKSAYNQMRNEYAKQKFGLQYDDLSREDQKSVRQEYPLKISEAEPEDFTGKGG
ncbi:MAG: ExbD/TolR family protein [Chitinophagales bacterium]